MKANLPYRVSHRLRGCDYSYPGAYYITLCTFRKRCLFGTIRNGKMCLNSLGEIVLQEWKRTADLRQTVTIGDFEVMPNHIHGVIIIVGPGSKDVPAVRTQPLGPPKGSLGAIVANFKASVTRKIRRQIGDPRLRVWQRDYYDHIIRDDDDWAHIRAYIYANAGDWSFKLVGNVTQEGWIKNNPR